VQVALDSRLDEILKAVFLRLKLMPGSLSFYLSLGLEL